MNRRVRLAFLSALLVLIGALAFATDVKTGGGRPSIVTKRLDGAIVVGEAGDRTDLQTVIDQAPAGATIEVRRGVHNGPITIEKPLLLIGMGNPVIDGGGEGTVVRITDAPGTELRGFIIANSGGSFDKEDSAVYLDTSDTAVIRDNQLVNVLFGINVAQSHDIAIDGNEIVGNENVEMGLRGDGIKVWYSHRVQITNNNVSYSRDVLVWYANESVVTNNTVRNGRYGFHFMNGEDGIAERNILAGNSVGIYLMYGKRFIIKDNVLQSSRGPSGQGLGLKEIDGVEVEGNVMFDNRVGIYIDNSPLSPDVSGQFNNNLIAYNDSGLVVLASTRHNIFSDNALVENLEQVTVPGGGSLGDNEWEQGGVGNYWSDYVGYDADGDGIGDVPYRADDFSEQLMSSWPILQLYRFSLAESAVDFGARAMPLFRTEPKLTDPAPLVELIPPANAATPEHKADQRTARLWSAALLVAAAGSLSWVGLARRRADRVIASAVGRQAPLAVGKPPAP